MRVVLGLLLFSSFLFGAGGESRSAAVLTLCFAEQGACSFADEIPVGLATYDVAYLPASAMEPEEMEKTFCERIAAHHEDFLIVHLAGMGVLDSEGWRMDWAGASGTPRGARKASANELIGRASDCLGRSSVKRADIILDGCLPGGECFRSTQEAWPSRSSMVVKSMQALPSAEARGPLLQLHLRAAEK
jgi:hypothetical protein